MRKSATTLQSEMHDDESECLYQTLKTGKLCDKHLEIGTAAGGTLKGMMQCYDDKDRPPFVVIDPMSYFPGQLQIVKRNLSQGGLNPKDVDFRIGISSTFYDESETEKERFSFILIDGSHKARYVMQDLRWAKLLEKGGRLCLHDYAQETKGVMTAVNRFMKKNDNYQIINHIGSLLVIEKIAESCDNEVSSFDLTITNIISLLHQIESSVRKRLPKLL